MIRSAAIRFAAATILVLPTLAVFAQELSLSDLLKGGQLKSTISPAEIPDGWHAAKIGVAGQQGFFDSLMPMMMFSGGGGSDSQRILEILKVIELSWTNGEWRIVDGDSYLITYKMDFDMKDLMSMREPELTRTPTLNLRLVRKSTISSIEPRPEFTKDDFQKALAPPDLKFTTQSESAKKAATLSNLKQLAIGMIMYTTDYDDVLPYAQGTEAVKYVTQPYIKNNSLWATLNPNGGNIVYNVSIGGSSMTDIPAPADTVLYYETNVWPDGTRAVAFVDGHAKYISNENWPTISKSLKLKIKKRAKPLPLNYGLGKVAGSPEPDG